MKLFALLPVKINIIQNLSIMKKFVLLSVLLLLFSLFNACEEEEKNLLLGKWMLQLVTYEYYEDDLLVDSGMTSYYDFKYLEFFKGGEGNVWLDKIEYDTFTWRKDGKTIYVDEGTENEQVIEINELLKTALVFTITMEEEEGGVVYRHIHEITMSKVD